MYEPTVIEPTVYETTVYDTTVNDSPGASSEPVEPSPGTLVCPAGPGTCSLYQTGRYRTKPVGKSWWDQGGGTITAGRWRQVIDAVQGNRIEKNDPYDDLY